MHASTYLSDSTSEWVGLVVGVVYENRHFLKHELPSVDDLDMAKSVDVFGGTDVQQLGEERKEGVVFSISLKRTRCGSLSREGSQLLWHSHKVRLLKAGTVEKLVEYLAPYRQEVDVSYRTCFLCTYRTFTTTARILQLLIDRYAAMSPVPSDTGDMAEDKTAVQSSIISFLHVWLESYPSDFFPTSHPSALTILEAFTNEWCSHSDELQRALEGVRRESRKRLLLPSCDDVLSDTRRGYRGPDSQPLTLFTLSPEEFAHSLTAEEAYLFHEIVPNQCLAYIRHPKESHAPTIRACIKHFNRVSWVVIATILVGVAAERGRVISRWIEVAHHCRLVKNFSSLKAIVCGLQSSAVFRLNKSWETLTEEKCALFAELSELFTADDNHYTSRSLLNREGTAKYPEVTLRKGKAGKNGIRGSAPYLGVVPYLGTFLTDLTMLHTAHADTTLLMNMGIMMTHLAHRSRYKDGLVNFDKRRKEFEILAQLTLFQKAATNYSFQHRPLLVQWLRETPVYSEDESYALSKALEAGDIETSGLEPHSPTHTSLFKKTLRSIFVSKGTAVYDCSAHPKEVSLQTRFSVDNLKSSSMSDLREEGSPRHGCYVVRVAVSSDEKGCLYKSIMLNESDKAARVIQTALEKHDLQGCSSQYDLVQLLGDSKKLKIPHSANVYYALSTTHEQQPSLLLELKESMSPKKSTIL